MSQSVFRKFSDFFTHSITRNKVKGKKLFLKKKVVKKLFFSKKTNFFLIFTTLLIYLIIKFYSTVSGKFAFFLILEKSKFKK